MSKIQKLIPVLARLSYVMMVLLTFKILYSHYFGEIVQVRQSSILLLAVVLTFFVAKVTIRFARVYVGGSSDKSNCPITIINKNRQGKWLDKSHLVKRSYNTILFCGSVLLVYVYVIAKVMSYFWYV